LARDTSISSNAPLGGDRRQPLVPEGDRQVDQPHEVAHEGARRLGAGPDEPSMLIGSPMTAAPTRSVSKNFRSAAPSLGELLAHQHRSRRRVAKAEIGHGKADRLRPEVETGNDTAGRQGRPHVHEIDHGQDLVLSRFILEMAAPCKAQPPIGS
jgi:hypothetical protein